MNNSDIWVKKIFILGPQGSGKDTQSELLSKKLGIPYFSMGELLRQRAKQNDELGRKIKELLRTGNLLPLNIVVEILLERVEKEDCKKGFILNGYPRSIEQYNAIKGKLEPDVVILINVSDKVSVERISKRMQCPKCGRVFIVENYDPENPPVCDVCKVPLLRREDDKPEAIKRRLEIYHKETKPVIDIYRKQGVLVEVDGEKTIQEVFSEIMAKLREFKKD